MSDIMVGTTGKSQILVIKMIKAIMEPIDGISSKEIADAVSGLLFPVIKIDLSESEYDSLLGTDCMVKDSPTVALQVIKGILLEGSRYDIEPALELVDLLCDSLISTYAHVEKSKAWRAELRKMLPDTQSEAIIAKIDYWYPALEELKQEPMIGVPSAGNMVLLNIVNNVWVVAAYREGDTYLSMEEVEKNPKVIPITKIIDVDALTVSQLHYFVSGYYPDFYMVVELYAQGWTEIILEAGHEQDRFPSFTLPQELKKGQ